MSYKVIDFNKYPRKQHFDYFRSLQYPYVGVSVEVDVTDVYNYAKRNNRSFFLSFLHAVALAADSVEQFRHRIHEGMIVQYDECPTSHTELLEDGSYCYCTLHHHMDLDSYFEKAEKERIACLNNGINEDDDVESMYFITSLPWLNYTSLIQPVAGNDESNPRISWGKYIETEDNKVMMPVTVLAHHSLVDGIHIGLFYENLNKEILKYKEL